MRPMVHGISIAPAFTVPMLYLFLLFSVCFAFEGQEHWPSYLSRCYKTMNGDATRSDLKCYLVNDKLHIFKVEVLSTNPILLRYHQLIHRRLCKRVIKEVDSMVLQRATVVSTDHKNPALLQTNRMANSTWVMHRERVSFNNMFNVLQRTLLAMDLSKAEDFNVLSYNKDGHYAPHYDFLEKDVISTAAFEGNRITTVLTILQTAKKGGTTIFPRLNVNVRPGRGDVLVWHNIKVGHDRDDDTVHAACPIIEGTKIGATLWVRAFGQELRMPCTQDKLFPLDAYLKPNAKQEDRAMFCKTVGPE